MKITLLDAATLGDDLDLNKISELGETEIFDITEANDVAGRIKDTDVIMLNKVKLGEHNLKDAKKLRLICVAATGYDNIDIEYCKKKGITVCNVIGYSTDSVAQTTVASVLEMATHVREYSRYVSSGEYTFSGKANKVTPVYHELSGKTWGIVGYGNIGKKVGEIAKAFGCRVVVNKRTFDPNAECLALEELCRISDIITIHTPLTSETRGLIGVDMISRMKKDVIIYNAARGAVTDEEAIASAVMDGRIGSFGTDVYSVEPFDETHPMFKIKDMPNVCLTPHMAWGSYEARCRVLDEMIQNIRAYYSGNPRNALN